MILGLVRRPLPRVLQWLLLFVMYAGIKVLFDRDRSAESLASTAIVAAIYATLFPWAVRKGQQWRARGREDECRVRWRTYADDGRPGRWKGGWLRRSGDMVVAIPMTGDAGPRIHPDDVRSVTESPGRRRDVLLVGDSRVLEVALAHGRVDLTVEAKDVPDVRRWLGRDDSPS